MCLLCFPSSSKIQAASVHCCQGRACQPQIADLSVFFNSASQLTPPSQHSFGKPLGACYWSSCCLLLGLSML